MLISQLSKLTGVSPRSIRHYEKKNLLSSNRLRNAYREFDESAITRIKTIQLYLSFGLTTDEIAEILKCEDNLHEMDMYCEEMLEPYVAKLHEVKNQMNMLASVHQQLEKQINQIKENLSPICRQ
ncbi:MerR family transcriptional regulator [Brevibacillus brevis]|uniref:MerR family transcriptional regulator n=1 Tax=Brevibacillus brevis TaxID=1393 RepID=A0ABY9T8H3_BREBE|nr:MerR family transcriptional regulator [Brevibacillus brevis]WNC15222.1 MerR family transcriptional regulator [Brevibacillus brevis]